MRYTAIIALIFIGLALSQAVPTYHEQYRPGYHFTPPQNWMNDPNGLLYLDGEYHLFYQYNPQGTSWGHMSWGHAVSTDLVHWQNLDVAIPEYDGIMIFSGSAIADKDNKSGLCDPSLKGKGCILAFYTAQSATGQAQAVAYSNDNGRTFTQYANNPIIDEKLVNFRDPKVFYHAPTKKWIMITVLADVQKVRLYGSTDLLHWNKLSEFGPAGQVDAAWECPDLFPMDVENESITKWVMLTSAGPHVQYFVGDFDGTTFVNDNNKDLVLILDQGKDHYATVTFNDALDNRRLSIGWLNNWAYAGNLPTTVWRGQQSIVRDLRLQRYAAGFRILQWPVHELTQLRANPVHYDNLQLNSAQPQATLQIQGSQLEIIAAFKYPLSGNTPTEFGVKVFVGQDQETVIGYNVTSYEVFVDRTKSGVNSFSDNFAAKSTAVMNDYINGLIQLHIFVDQSSIDLFANTGRVTMSHLIYPDSSKNQVVVYAVGGDVLLTQIDAWTLNSIWPTAEEKTDAPRNFIPIQI